MLSSVATQAAMLTKMPLKVKKLEQLNAATFHESSGAQIEDA
jgi:hypothetical protein